MANTEEIRQAQQALNTTAAMTALGVLLRALSEAEDITPRVLKEKLAPALDLATKVINVANNVTDAELRAIVEASKPATGTLH